MFGQSISNVLRYLSFMLVFILMSLFPSTLTSENNSMASTMNTDEAKNIHCHFAYRVSERKSHEWNKDILLVKNTPVKLRKGEFKINAYYINTIGDSPSLWITVEDTIKGKKLSQQLYQFETLSDLINVGGFGFTGLNYVYAPNSQAELQYYCTIENNP